MILCSPRIGARCWHGKAQEFVLKWEIVFCCYSPDGVECCVASEGNINFVEIRSTLWMKCTQRNNHDGQTRIWRLYSAISSLCFFFWCSSSATKAGRRTCPMNMMVRGPTRTVELPFLCVFLFLKSHSHRTVMISSPAPSSNLIKITVTLYSDPFLIPNRILCYRFRCFWGDSTNEHRREWTIKRQFAD